MVGTPVICRGPCPRCCVGTPPGQTDRAPGLELPLDMGRMCVASLRYPQGESPSTVGVPAPDVPNCPGPGHVSRPRGGRRRLKERLAMTDTGGIERKVRIQNRKGLHSRPAAEFVKLAGTFGAEIRLTKGDLQVNGKSIMGVLMLAAAQGTELVIQAKGSDARDAADALGELVESGFGES